MNMTKNNLVRLAASLLLLATPALSYADNKAEAALHGNKGNELAQATKYDEALVEFTKAIELSPHDPFRWAFYSYRALAHLFRHEFAEAATWARRSSQIPKALYWAHAHLASALGHGGDKSQIETALADLRRVKPGFSVQFARQRLFYLKRAEQLDLYLDGLRKAGVPEQ